MKDFDIYLHGRLTECDVIVYSIPYRDDLTVIDRIILACNLGDCLLQKICFPAESAIGLGVETEMFYTKMAQPQNPAIAIGSERLGLLETVAEKADEGLQIGIEANKAFILRRFRLLREVDDKALSDIDGMTLDDLDYVILEE